MSIPLNYVTRVKNGTTVVLRRCVPTGWKGLKPLRIRGVRPTCPACPAIGLTKLSLLINSF